MRFPICVAIGARKHEDTRNEDGILTLPLNLYHG